MTQSNLQFWQAVVQKETESPSYRRTETAKLTKKEIKRQNDLMWAAAKKGELERVEEALQAGADINARDNGGRGVALLTFFLDSGNLGGLELTLRYKPESLTPENPEHSPLALAIRTENMPAVNLLAKAGVSLLSPREKGDGDRWIERSLRQSAAWFWSWLDRVEVTTFERWIEVEGGKAKTPQQKESRREVLKRMIYLGVTQGHAELLSRGVDWIKKMGVEYDPAGLWDEVLKKDNLEGMKKMVQQGWSTPSMVFSKNSGAYTRPWGGADKDSPPILGGEISIVWKVAHNASEKILRALLRHEQAIRQTEEDIKNHPDVVMWHVKGASVAILSQLIRAGVDLKQIRDLKGNNIFHHADIKKSHIELAVAMGGLSLLEECNQSRATPLLLLQKKSTVDDYGRIWALYEKAQMVEASKNTPALRANSRLRL